MVAVIAVQSVSWCRRCQSSVVVVRLCVWREFFCANAALHTTFSVFYLSFTFGLTVDNLYKPHSTLDTCIRMALARLVNIHFEG